MTSVASFCKRSLVLLILLCLAVVFVRLRNAAASKIPVLVLGSSTGSVSFVNPDPLGPSTRGLRQGPNGLYDLIGGTLYTIDSDGHATHVKLHEKAGYHDFGGLGLSSEGLWLANVYPTTGLELAQVTPHSSRVAYLPPFPIAPYGSVSGTVGSPTRPELTLWLPQYPGHPDTLLRVHTHNHTTTPIFHPNPGFFLEGLAEDPDGDVWFSEESSSGIQRIGRLSLSGALREFPLPLHGPLDNDESLFPAADHSVWFGVSRSNQIGHLLPNGKVTLFTIPSPRTDHADAPVTLTTGPDSSVWFTETITNRIGHIAKNGTVTTYEMPDKSAPDGIAFDAAGHLWVAFDGLGQIDRLTLAEQEK